MKKLLLTLLLLTTTPLHAEQKLICIGDSVSYGLWVLPEDSFCELSGGIRYGNNGSRADQILPNLPAILKAENPDVATVMFGLNDCAVDDGKTEPRASIEVYEQSINDILDLLQKKKVKPILMTSNAIGDQTNPLPNRNVNIKKCVEVARKIAKKRDIPLVDVYQNYSELFMEGMGLKELTVDGVHPTVYGHALIAEQLRPVLTQVKRQGNK